MDTETNVKGVKQLTSAMPNKSGNWIVALEKFSRYKEKQFTSWQVMAQVKSKTDRARQLWQG